MTQRTIQKRQRRRKTTDLAWYGQVWRCPPLLPVSRWADAYRRLSGAAESGRWVTSRYPYQREFMDALSDPRYEAVVWMSSTQVGKTECASNWLGWIMDQDPSPVIVVLPDINLASEFSTDRFARMVSDTPKLTGKLRESRGKQEKEDGLTNRTLLRSFPGGKIKFVGSNSVSGLASTPARYVYGDEVDRWAPAAGDEGDQIQLVRRRMDSYWNRKAVWTSTPGLKATSRIEPLYNDSDQRKFYLPCPHCTHAHVLRWLNFKWDKGAKGEHLPDTAHFECSQCHGRIAQHHMPAMLAAGEWRAENPTQKRVAGFWIWAAYARPWRDIVLDFLVAKARGTEAMKTFVNTVLAETYEEKTEQPKWEIISSRAEPALQWIVPDKVLFLSAGIDVQDDRIEVSVWGWGLFEEGWLLGHTVLWGNTEEHKVYAELDAFLLLAWDQPTKQTRLRLTLAMMDSGHKTNMVYLFARTRPYVYAAKGSSTSAARMVGRPTGQDVLQNGRTVPDGIQLWPIGTHAIKKDLYGRLSIEAPGPRYLHFPHGLDDEYYQQLTAEKLVRHWHKGVQTEEWKKDRPRNEALDCFVLSYAAAHEAMFIRPAWIQMHARLGFQMQSDADGTLITIPMPQPVIPYQSQSAGRRFRRQPGVMNQLRRGE